jgi:hypothetical protein
MSNTEKPIHTHLTRYYKILKPCLWFAEGDKIDTEKFSQYFTQKAIVSLMKYQFIELNIKR